MEDPSARNDRDHDVKESDESAVSPAARHSDSARRCAEWLIVFARYPEPGMAKTRLIPALGPARAAQLQEALTRRTLRAAHALVESRDCLLEVRFAGGCDTRLREMFGGTQPFVPQHGNDLGERMEDAVVAAFNAGARRVVVIGTDCPDLDQDRLSAAFSALDTSDVAVGPAEDGGYYLIGMNRHFPGLFRGIPWSTEEVLRRTLLIASEMRLRVALLPTLSDIDQAEDLLICRRWPADFSDVLAQKRVGVLSVVVPAINEEQSIAAAIAPLTGQPNIEVILADGGSHDETVKRAERLGARVVHCQRGRGRQMNAGAAIATGDALLFLHADSRLPAGFHTQIRDVLARPGVVGGAFRLNIDSQRRAMRWVEWAVNQRSHWLQSPYGDQGLFVAADRFYAMGGFPHWPLMEDYEFCRRLRRHGRIVLVQNSIKTSARRWDNLGIVRTTLINQCILLGFHLGVSPQRLARWYTTRRPA